MLSFKKIVCLSAILAATLIAGPVRADWCLQLNGEISSALGFFRFTGARPTQAGKIVPLTGRVAGLGPAYGTATVQKDGSTVELGVTFWADAEEGQFDVWLRGPRFNKGDGYAGYGQYGTTGDVTAKVVACKDEP